MEALQAFKLHYLDKEEITLRTDCQAIISFYNKTAANKPSRVRWLGFTDFITGTGIEIRFEHITGRENILADSLSRLVHCIIAGCVTGPEVAEVDEALEELRNGKEILPGGLVSELEMHVARSHTHLFPTTAHKTDVSHNALFQLRGPNPTTTAAATAKEELRHAKYEARVALEKLCSMFKYATEHTRQQAQQAQDEEALWAATQKTQQAETQQQAMERICKQLAQLLEET